VRVSVINRRVNYPSVPKGQRDGSGFIKMAPSRLARLTQKAALVMKYCPADAAAANEKRLQRKQESALLTVFNATFILEETEVDEDSVNRMHALRTPFEVRLVRPILILGPPSAAEPQLRIIACACAPGSIPVFLSSARRGRAHQPNGDTQTTRFSFPPPPRARAVPDTPTKQDAGALLH
jgi:hypothetical protein